LAALDLRAGDEQPIDCLIKDRQAVHSTGMQARRQICGWSGAKHTICGWLGAKHFVIIICFEQSFMEAYKFEGTLKRLERTAPNAPLP